MFSISISLTSCYVYKPVIKQEGSIPKSAVIRNDYVRIVLMSGEKIQKMKVISIDSTKLEGLRYYIKSDGSVYQRNEIVFTKDIKSLKLRKETWFGDFNGGSGLWGVW